MEVFFIINIGYAIGITIQKVKDGSKTITHVLLVILAGNMMLYLFYYIVQKTIENLKRKKLKKKQRGKENGERVESRRKQGGASTVAPNATRAVNTLVGRLP